jgi:hypothetical protein
MQLLVDIPSMSTNAPELIVEHKGLKLVFNVSNFDKRVFTSIDNDVTKHINQYWASLAPVTQDSIFECFNAIRNTLEDVFETTALTKTLVPQIKDLFDYHPLADIEHWIHWKSDIIIPTKFEEAYVVDDMKPGNRDKTYTRPDYSQLVALAIQLRLMIPIWGEFIYRTKGDTGTNFKEYHSFQLLSATDTMESPAMEKLRTYVDANIQKDKSIDVHILNGIGSEDYSMWMLSLVIVRRLCIGDITGSNPITNLVTFIFNYVSQKVAGTQNAAFGKMVKPKVFESANQSDDHNASRTEGYKIKQEIPTGDISIIEYYLNNPYKVKDHLLADIPNDLLQLCLDNAYKLQLQQLQKPQIVISQWTLAKVVPPRAMVHMTKQKVLNAFAITQAWLWYRGHKELACLQTAISTKAGDELQLGGIDSRARITREQMEILQRLYPFSVIRNQKQKTKPVNDAVAAIDAVAASYSQRDWVLTTPENFNSQIQINNHQNRYSAPHDIKILLARLAIDLKQDFLSKLSTTLI